MSRSPNLLKITPVITARQSYIDAAVYDALKFYWSKGGNYGAASFIQQFLTESPNNPVSVLFVSNVRDHFRESQDPGTIHLYAGDRPENPDDPTFGALLMTVAPRPR